MKTKNLKSYGGKLIPPFLNHQKPRMTQVALLGPGGIDDSLEDGSTGI